jgi:predicted RNA binding protein YcfA (HicA-like mRNA interferase family)
MMRRNSKRGGARRSSNKEISELIQKARDQGWVVMSSAGGHWIFRGPDKTKPQVIVSGSPSDVFALKAAKGDLRRSGLVLNSRRRLRRNPSMTTGMKVGIGAAAAVVAYFLLRPSTTTIMTPAGPVTVPVGGPTASASIASVFAARREAEIASGMARGLTREAATARYDRAAALVGGLVAAARPVSGLGSYYRS